MGQQRGGRCDECHDGEENGRQAWQDGGADRRNPKQQTTQQVADPKDRVARRKSTYVCRAGVTIGNSQRTFDECGGRYYQHRRDEQFDEDEAGLQPEERRHDPKSLVPPRTANLRNEGAGVMRV